MHPVVGERTNPAGVRRPSAHSGTPLIALGCSAAVGLVVVVQLFHLDELLDPTQPLTAGWAKALVLGYALAVVAIVGLAAVLPAERLWLPVAASASLLGVALVATLLIGGELWSFAWAALTLTACWQVGHWALGALRTPMLASVPAIALLAGLGIAGLTVLGIGRAGLLSWWTMAAPFAALGLLGAVELWRTSGARAIREACLTATSTRLATASSSVCLLMMGLASVWVAAPELTYDALYFKEWLPSEWARTGEITPQILHPVLNFFGLSQLIATPGHLAGAEGVGRYLQWFVYGLLVVTIWWAGRRSPWGPAAGAAVALTPQLFWQATTAFDDLVLALAGVAMALAVVRLLESPDVPPLFAGGALGLLAASCLNLKIHMVPLAVGLVIGWLLLRGRRGTPAAIGGVLGGGLLFSLPPLLLRWIDTGNPVMPSYNNIFESAHWPPIHMTFAFPKIEDPGPLGPISTVWTTINDTASIESYSPDGALGLLSVAVAVALLTTWRWQGDGGRASLVLWIGLLFGAASWYLQFRSTRYLLPIGAVAVLLIVLAISTREIGHRVERAALVSLALAAVLLWPSSVGVFFYVPGRDIPWRAALGLVDDREYEEEATAEREAVAAFDRLAPAGALAVGDAHQRSWLTEGRDLAPFWELDIRLRIGEAAPADPATTLARVRQAGVTWVLAYNEAGALGASYPYMREMLETYGRGVWSSPFATLYRLPEPGPGE